MAARSRTVEIGGLWAGKHPQKVGKIIRIIETTRFNGMSVAVLTRTLSKADNKLYAHGMDAPSVMSIKSLHGGFTPLPHYTVEQAAAVLMMPVATIAQRISEGKIRAITDGEEVLIPMDWNADLFVPRTNGHSESASAPPPPITTAHTVHLSHDDVARIATEVVRQLRPVLESPALLSKIAKRVIVELDEATKPKPA